jgi:hypothetical protein
VFFGELASNGSAFKVGDRLTADEDSTANILRYN